MKSPVISLKKVSLYYVFSTKKPPNSQHVWWRTKHYGKLVIVYNAPLYRDNAEVCNLFSK